MARKYVGRGDRMRRSLRWTVPLAREEADMIFGAAGRSGLKATAWGRQALLRVALLQGLPVEIEQAAESGGEVPRPRVVGRKR